MKQGTMWHVHVLEAFKIDDPTLTMFPEEYEAVVPCGSRWEVPPA